MSAAKMTAMSAREHQDCDCGSDLDMMAELVEAARTVVLWEHGYQRAEAISSLRRVLARIEGSGE